MMEKDLVVIYVARVRAALLASGKYRVVLTRTGDVNMSAEQRDQAANTSSAIYFLSFHAGDLGGASPSVAVFTFQSPDAAPPGDSSATAADAAPVPVSSTPRISPPFLPWREVQQARLAQSVQLAQALQQQFSSINGVQVIPTASAPLLTLRSVNAPAAAIELGRLSPDAPATTLTDSAFQQQLATAIVQAFANYEKGGN
jgi:N-acetylmuramoyl-L-alanine amidase